MSAQSPLLDLERFKSIGVGSDPIIEKIFRRFLAHLPQSIEEIRNAHDAGDWETVRQKIHRLKGASLTCCFVGLAGHLARCQEAAELRGDLDVAGMSEFALKSSEMMEGLLQS